MVRVIVEISGDLRHLDERLGEVTAEIEALADDACQRLMTVPGIGPIIASAMVSAVGDGAAFGKGRDFAAWLGLVPRQMSTGHPRAHLQARQHLPAHALHSGRPGHFAET